MRKLFLLFVFTLVSVSSLQARPTVLGGVNPIKVDVYNTVPVVTISGRLLKWQSATDFNKGTLTNTEVIGSGDTAYVAIQELTDNNNNILYATSSYYTLSNDTNLEIAGGAGRLKAISGSSNDWTFATSGNYTVSDSSKIEVTGGIVQLKGITSVYAHWKLNESSGTLASDSSDNEYDGTAVNMEDGDWVSGKLNNGISFDGVDEYINCGQIASFERTDTFTIDFWVKPAVLANSHIISKMTSDIGWSVHAGNTGIIYVTLLNQNGPLKYARIKTNTSIFASPFTTWYHIVFVNDGTGDASGMKIYADGVLQAVTVVSDTLGTETIINSNDMNISGNQNGSTVFNGDIDEVVVYNDILTADEITARYNAGTGTEDVGFDQTNPTVVNNNGFIFIAALADFTETSVKTDSEIKYNISSDTGTTWEYWTGSSWTITNDTYAQASLASDISTNISTFASSGTFKFRAFLHSNDSSDTPTLDNITVSETLTFSTVDNFYIDTTTNTQVNPSSLIDWLTVTISSSSPTNTDIRILFSTDDRSNWQRWAGSSWTIVTDSITRSVATSITDTQTNFSELNLGEKTLDVRLFLYTSDMNLRPVVSNINITSDAGYSTTGTYTSNIYDSTYSSLNWGIIDWTVSGSTVSIQARASNDSTVMGVYSTAVLGEDSGVIGQYIQWSSSFTGVGTDVSFIDDLSINFSIPLIIEVNP